MGQDALETQETSEDSFHAINALHVAWLWFPWFGTFTMVSSMTASASQVKKLGLPALAAVPWLLALLLHNLFMENTHAGPIHGRKVGEG